MSFCQETKFEVSRNQVNGKALVQIRCAWIILRELCKLKQFFSWGVSLGGPRVPFWEQHFNTKDARSRTSFVGQSSVSLIDRSMTIYRQLKNCRRLGIRAFACPRFYFSILRSAYKNYLTVTNICTFYERLYSLVLSDPPGVDRFVNCRVTSLWLSWFIYLQFI